MNENINLYDILKGHEGETFYSKVHGDVKFEKIQELRSGIKYIICSYVSHINNCVYTDLFLPNGKIVEMGEVILVPSKDQQDWNKWIEEQKSKTPKTWSEYLNINKDAIKADCGDYCIDITGNKGKGWTRHNTPIEKSALALIKIYKLIEFSYGKNITDEEWENDNWKYVIGYYNDDKEFLIKLCVHDKSLIAFHTKEQAKEFLLYLENVQLLKDYYQIN